MYNDNKGMSNKGLNKYREPVNYIMEDDINISSNQPHYTPEYDRYQDF